MATANPSWMMLEPFVFRRDDADSFPYEIDAPFRAHGSTSRGDAITIGLHILPPPAISRLYLHWQCGPDPNRGSSCDLVAAHGNLLLLRLTSSPSPSSNKDEPPVCPQEHFICRASSSSSSIELQRIPMCTAASLVSPRRPSFPLHTVGVLCRGEQDFAIAQLRLSRPRPGADMEADLSVLRSDARTPECDHKWETEQRLPIRFNEPNERRYDEFTYWRTDKVVAFKTSLFWIDYCRGGILSCEVFQPRPTVTYIHLPMGNRNSGYEVRPFQDMHRSVCITRDGQEVSFIDVVPDPGYGRFVGLMSPGTAFTVECYALRTADDSGGSYYYWDKVFSVRSDELGRSLNPLTYPLVSMDKANIVHFLMSDRVLDGINKVSVVTVDMCAKKIVSACPYIDGTEDLEGKDSEMIKQKSRILQPFIPSELPKYF